MLPINKKLRLIAIGLGLSLLLGVMVNFIFAKLPKTINLAKALDKYFYNLCFSPTLTPRENLIIIDRQDPEGSGSRLEYATMIRRLDQAGAKCIALDIRFLGERSFDDSSDQELVRSVAECPSVILAIDFTSSVRPPALQLAKLKRLALPQAICENLFVQYDLVGVELPYEDLLRVTRHVGHVNSLNNQYYHFPPVIHFGNNCYPSLPLKIAELCLQPGDNETLESALLANIPLDSDEQMLVNFIPMHRFGPYLYSWSDARELLQNNSDVFRDTIVLIVNSSAEPSVPTPIGPYPHWAIIASVTSQILQNNYIEASALFYPSFFSGIIILTGLIWFLFITPRMGKEWRKTRTLFMAGNGTFFLIIFVLLRFGHQWIGVFIPLFMFNISLLVVRKSYYDMLRPPQYLDFGIAILEQKAKKYPIQVFQSFVGEDTTEVSFNSFLEEQKFQDTIDRIKEWEASREDIKWIGNKLFNTLFQSEIYTLLKNSLDKAKQEKKNVRLKLRIDAPELMCLCWELMHSSDLDAEYLALHKRLSFTRYLPLSQGTKQSEYRIPIKILVVISSASDLEVTKEKKLIKKALRPLLWSWDVRLRICVGATLENLSRELERKPDILHYIGHSHFDTEKKEAYLEFESDNEEPDKVFSGTLKNLLMESSLRLAVLNSCESSTAAETDAFSGIAQNLLKVGIPAVVAMQYKIPDHTAIWFSKTFYSKLLANYSIDAAVTEARRYIMTKTGLDQQDWAMPVLFMRKDGGLIFNSSNG